MSETSIQNSLGTEISYHGTEREARLAATDFNIRYGRAAEYTVISPPNHDRPYWGLVAAYDLDLVERPRPRNDLLMEWI